MNANINKTLITYVLIGGVVVLIAASIFQSCTKISPPISTPVTTPTKEVREAPTVSYAIPVNPLPTDNEIVENVRARNKQEEAAKQAIADKMKKIARISAEIRANQREQSLTTDANKQKLAAQPAGSAFAIMSLEQMPKEMLQNIKSRRYLLH